MKNLTTPTNPNAMQWGAGKLESPALPLKQWAKRTDPVGRPGRPRGGVCPKGEDINPNNVQPVICPSGVDTRFTVDPSERVIGGFLSLGVGRYFDR